MVTIHYLLKACQGLYTGTIYISRGSNLIILVTGAQPVDQPKRPEGNLNLGMQSNSTVSDKNEKQLSVPSLVWGCTLPMNLQLPLCD